MTAPERRRLFFALWPDEVTRAALADRSAALPADSGGRIVPANLHITLVFLGALTAEQRAAVEAAADRIVMAPFTLMLDRYGYWRGPQVIWAGSGVTPVALRTLVNRLRLGAAACGVPVDRRPYQIHSTLYRRVRRAPHSWPLFAPLVWPAKAFTLIESVPGARGVCYAPRRSWVLSGVNSTSG